jgi:hypothetical protein
MRAARTTSEARSRYLFGQGKGPLAKESPLPKTQAQDVRDNLPRFQFLTNLRK